MDSGLRGTACAFAMLIFPLCASAQSSDVLERDAYVRAVLLSHPGLAGARQGVRAAHARARQAGAFEDPMVELSLAPLSVGSERARLGYEVGARQTLPWFGKRALERDAMSAEAAASESDLETQKRDIALAAVALYDRYYVAFRALEINAQHVALMQSLRASATAQFEAGRGAVEDALQAEAELTHLEHDAVLLATERDVLAAEMNQLLHRDPTVPLPPPVAVLAVGVSSDADDANGLEREAVEHRAEVASARLHARAEAAKADAAGRDYYPSFTLSTSYSSMWDMPQHRWLVGVGFNLPFGTERRSGAVDEARAASAQYESEVLRASDQVKTQVYVAARKLRESQHVLELFERRLLPVAREQVDAAQAAFVASRGSFAALVQAEKNLRGAELDSQTARAEYDLRQAELDRARGRMPGQEGRP
jgi:cobalt-zinc-cadmium efflux system outer membrane protein